jgi:hypothetical protein
MRGGDGTSMWADLCKNGQVSDFLPHTPPYLSRPNRVRRPFITGARNPRELYTVSCHSPAPQQTLGSGGRWTTCIAQLPCVLCCPLHKCTGRLRLDPGCTVTLAPK